MDLRHWVNEGLMTLFFLVVGLEAKRQLDLGELRERRRLAIPVFAAIGGITVPILIYLAFNAGSPGAHGWGAAMSTDTAFALGAVALVTSADRDAYPGLPAHAGGGRRSRGAGRDRDRLHDSCFAGGAQRRDRRCSSCWWHCAMRRLGGVRSRSGWRWRSGSRCSSPGSIRSSPDWRSGWRPARTRPRARTSSGRRR